VVVTGKKSVEESVEAKDVFRIRREVWVREETWYVIYMCVSYFGCMLLSAINARNQQNLSVSSHVYKIFRNIISINFKSSRSVRDNKDMIVEVINKLLECPVK